MAKKGFKGDNPLTRMGTVKKIPLPEIQKEEGRQVNPPVDQPDENVPDLSLIQTQPKDPTTKKKLGRPKVKVGEYKTINISVPVAMLEQMDTAKLKYSNNLTAYINAVVQADLDKNYDRYLEIKNILNSKNYN